ncbi:winged helix DNA-binding domain-containing protein [Streptomyces apocyni]|uniref:winged helix DNA-binding domain-containing protein n=1 Tax=Streptomyces apocyni TaxID=2654677 RepID=UPI0012E9EC29|nr:winged helix DNA-binding domain-containing protein [Streptomyces apocyni]
MANPSTDRHPGPLFDRRSLNRALLERQLLLERHKMSALEVLEHLVGMQAQSPKAPYVGLWTRLADFRHEELAELLTSREAVRLTLMRGTVHLVSARDCRGLHPLLRPLFDRLALTQYGKRLDGLSADTVIDAGRALLEERPLTGAALGRALGERWPGLDPSVLAGVVRTRQALVQIPPRGLWDRAGQATYATAESWLGAPLAAASLEAMVLRYLAAFGPASVRDVQAWSGLTHLREVTEPLRPRLLVGRDERGVELFDLPDAPRPDPDTPVTPRFVAEFDNLTLSHAERSRVISDAGRKAVFTKNGQIPGMFLVDGFVQGTWKVTQRRKAATLLLTPFARLRKRDATALLSGGEALLRFAADGAETYDVQLAQPLN